MGLIDPRIRTRVKAVSADGEVALKAKEVAGPGAWASIGPLRSVAMSVPRPARPASRYRETVPVPHGISSGAHAVAHGKARDEIVRVVREVNRSEVAVIAFANSADEGSGVWRAQSDRRGRARRP